MADIFSNEERSDIMSRIRSKNTKPELLVFRFLRRNKIYFQKHYRSKEGIILDIALPRKKRAVFIDGDFWHGRTIENIVEKHGENSYWTKKLKRNIERDLEQRELLANNGWSIYAVWASDLMRKRTRYQVLGEIKLFLEKEVTT